MENKYYNKRSVILFKYGGNAMSDDGLKKEVLENICLFKKKYDVVIVHGGGPFIKSALKGANIESEFIDGHRITTAEAFECVEKVLKGKVGGNLVKIINKLGYKAVGLSGKDGNMVLANKRMHKRLVKGKSVEVDLGLVGNIVKVDPSLIKLLLENDYIPVISCLASGTSENDYNINGDMFAGHIAGALNVSKYIVLTDVDGLLHDKNDPNSLIREIDLSEMSALIKKNIIQGGMIPKMESCEIAINKGAQSARIINGTIPDQILAIIDEHQVGTLITK
ncbi:MAG: acetylglutamate kinase [candidate division Zixibacteria bacterium]|nr:acetylglutamate kinase [candidate division Zixibacteria bacterium]